MPGKPNGTWSALSEAANIGFTTVATVAVGLFAGRWADNYLDAFPWFTVAGIVVGMLAGLWSIYKKIVKS